MENKFLKATKLLFAVLFLLTMNACKQKQSVTQAKYKDLDKIAVEGKESAYTKKQTEDKLVELEEVLDAVEKKLEAEKENTVKKPKTNDSPSVKEKIAQVKDIIEESVLHKNTASTSSPKTSFKEKVKRSKLAFKHIKQLNKIKKALKKDESKGSVSLLLLIIAILLALILLALLGLDLITLLVLTLLVLVIYLLLIS